MKLSDVFKELSGVGSGLEASTVYAIEATENQDADHRQPTVYCLRNYIPLHYARSTDVDADRFREQIKARSRQEIGLAVHDILDALDESSAVVISSLGAESNYSDFPGDESPGVNVDVKFTIQTVPCSAGVIARLLEAVRAIGHYGDLASGVAAVIEIARDIRKTTGAAPSVRNETAVEHTIRMEAKDE